MERYADEVRAGLSSPERRAGLKPQGIDEQDRRAPAKEPLPAFEAVLDRRPELLSGLTAIVDDGLAEDGLDYREIKQIDGQVLEVSLGMAALRREHLGPP